MNPADLIETALREHLRLRLGKRALTDAMLDKPIMLSGGEAGAAGRIAVDALKAAGIALVPVDLLCDIEKALSDLGACDNPDCEDEPCLRVLPRLRAALPERTDHA